MDTEAEQPKNQRGRNRWPPDVKARLVERLKEIMREGTASNTTIAEKLNAAGFRRAAGKPWCLDSVSNLIRTELGNRAAGFPKWKDSQGEADEGEASLLDELSNEAAKLRDHLPDWAHEVLRDPLLNDSQRVRALRRGPK